MKPSKVETPFPPGKDASHAVSETNIRDLPQSQHSRSFRTLSLVILAGLCLLAFWVRVPTISEGMPHFYREDEAHHHNRTVNMVKTGNLNPGYFHKPSLHFYLRIPFVAAGFLWNVREGHIRKVDEMVTIDPYGIADYAFTSSHPGIVKANRSMSVLLSILVVLFGTLLTTRITGSLAASLSTGLLIAFSPALLKHSGTVGVDMLMTFFSCATVFVGAGLFKRYSLSGLALCGILAGLTISSKYNALPIAIIPMIILILRKEISPLAILTALLTPIIGFFIGSPYILSSIPLFLNQIGYEIWHYGVAGHVGNTAEPGTEQALFYLSWLAEDAIGVLALILAAAGVFSLFLKSPRITILLLSFPLLFFLLMITQRANFTRNMLPVIPFIAIFAGIGIGQCIQRARTLSFLLFPVLLALVLLQPALASFDLRKEIHTIPESRHLVKNWILENHEKYPSIATAGELQFQIQLYQLPGISRVSTEDTSELDFYLDGFDLLVRAQRKQEQRIFPIIKKFSGKMEKQRVMKNPAVSVIELKAPIGATYLPIIQKRIFERPDTKKNIKLFPTKGESPLAECIPPQGAGLETPDHCWTTTRYTFFKIADFTTLKRYSRYRRNVPLKLELMTPWEEKTIKFSSGTWSKQLELSALPGQWNSLEISIPYTELTKEEGFFLNFQTVRSPAQQNISSDTRRLGMAIRKIELQ